MKMQVAAQLFMWPSQATSGFRYWFGIRSGGLGAEIQVIGVLGTLVIIWLMRDEMRQRHMVIAGGLAATIAVAFVCAGRFLALDWARFVCLELNLAQLGVLISMEIYRRWAGGRP